MRRRKKSDCPDFEQLTVSTCEDEDALKPREKHNSKQRRYLSDGPTAQSEEAEGSFWMVGVNAH